MGHLLCLVLKCPLFRLGGGCSMDSFPLHDALHRDAAAPKAAINPPSCRTQKELGRRVQVVSCCSGPRYLRPAPVFSRIVNIRKWAGGQQAGSVLRRVCGSSNTGAAHLVAHIMPLTCPPEVSKTCWSSVFIVSMRAHGRYSVPRGAPRG